MYNTQKILQIHPKDNILVALQNLSKGEMINIDNFFFELNADIKSKHKFSVSDLDIGEFVYMYGIKVGKTINRIKKGDLITTKNIVHDVEKYCIKDSFQTDSWNPPKLGKFREKTFLGYCREDGTVGTENNWLVIPLVFCQNRNVEVMKKTILRELGYENLSEKSYDLENLIYKFKSGSSIEDLLNVNIEVKKDNCKTK